ncbi:hypothetical protein Bca4012_093404 [Brassica carinata]
MDLLLLTWTSLDSVAIRAVLSCDDKTSHSKDAGQASWQTEKGRSSLQWRLRHLCHRAMGIEELDGLEQKAKASGASQLVVKDLTEEFAKDYIFPCLRAGAIYE